MRSFHLRLAVIAVVGLLMGSVALADAQPKGTVVVAQGVDPTTLDPQNHQETPAANLAINMFDALLERDADLKIVPALAESYKNVAPTVWEFKLRKGVKFHNGEAFDAEAVKFTVERIADAKLKLRGATPWAPLSHAEVVDPYTVRIHTKAPWPILDTNVTTLPILAPKYYREKDMPHVGRNTSVFTLGAPRQYCSLAVSSMRSSFTHRTNLNGPVPTGFRATWGMSFSR